MGSPLKSNSECDFTMREINKKLDHFSVLFEQAEWILGKEYS